jgi:cell division septation protein DedD
MTSKIKHIYLIIAVVLAFFVLLVPLFFQDVEVLPYLWFIHRIPPTPALPKVAEIPDITMAPAQPNQPLRVEAWVVRISKLNVDNQQDKLIEQLRATGFPAFLAPDGGGIWIGPELSYTAAKGRWQALPPALQTQAVVTTYSVTEE